MVLSEKNKGVHAVLLNLLRFHAAILPAWTVCITKIICKKQSWDVLYCHGWWAGVVDVGTNIPVQGLFKRVTALCLEPVPVFDKDVKLKSKLQTRLSLDCSMTRCVLCAVLYCSN